MSSEREYPKNNIFSKVLDYKGSHSVGEPRMLKSTQLLKEASKKQGNYLRGCLSSQQSLFITNRFSWDNLISCIFFHSFICFLIQLLMQVPREHIKIAFRLWIPILVLRIVVAETWPQATGLSTLALASIASDLSSPHPRNLLIWKNSKTHLFKNY